MKSWTTWLTAALAAGVAALGAAALVRVAPAVASLPQANAFTGELAQAFEKRYDEHFPGRTLGINVWAAIGYLLFREGKPGVVVGREHWLYTAEEFGAGPGAQPQVDAHLKMIAEVAARLEQHGSVLMVALVPAKTRVQSEWLGKRQPAELHRDLYGRALTELRSRSVAAPDLLGALVACKAAGDVFLRTDTHWTPDGARCAAERLANDAAVAGLRAPQPALYRTRVETVEQHRGDLMSFLPLDPWFSGLLPPADRLELRRTEPVDVIASGDSLLDEAPRPEVVLVGTSYSANPRWNFTGALQESFGEDVANYAAEARGPFVPMLEYLDSADFRSAPPRLVIWEMPERYFPLKDGPMADDAPDSTKPQGKTA
jgi:alginate O-acetyltransferase complex protein AlgJ